MAKVTEQDLIDLGFELHFKLDEYEIKINKFILQVNLKHQTITIFYKGESIYHNNITPANLDLFIAFANGQALD